jgi:hypothetical protein
MVALWLFGTLILGFAAGFLSFKTKDRWCPTCGGQTACCEAHARATSRSTTVGAGKRI